MPGGCCEDAGFDLEAFAAFMLGCGTYGSEAVRLARASGELEAGGYDPDASRGRLAYAWRRLAMVPEGRRFAYPVLGSSPLLSPAFIFARVVKGLKSASRVRREVAAAG